MRPQGEGCDHDTPGLLFGSGFTHTPGPSGRRLTQDPTPTSSLTPQDRPGHGSHKTPPPPVHSHPRTVRVAEHTRHHLRLLSRSRSTDLGRKPPCESRVPPSLLPVDPLPEPSGSSHTKTGPSRSRLFLPKDILLRRLLLPPSSPPTLSQLLPSAPSTTSLRPVALWGAGSPLVWFGAV